MGKNSKLWLSIMASFCSTIMVLWKIFQSARYAYSVLHVSKPCQDNVIPKVRQLSEKNAMKGADKLDAIATRVVSAREASRLRLCSLALVSILLIFNFILVAMKMFMGTFVCENRMWNLKFPITAGCVNLSQYSG